MSTRGAMGFVINGLEKIAYNNQDSYPSHLGEEIKCLLLGRDIKEIQRLAESLVCSSEPSCNIDSLEEILNKGFMKQNPEFLYDGLFCEWAYIINFDTNKFEVYKGFHRNKRTAKGRYRKGYGKDWYCVNLIGEYDFDNLPDMQTLEEGYKKLCQMS